MIRIAREWRCDYALMQFKRGCEGMSFGLPENGVALINAGIPTLAYEGKMADPGEFYEIRIMHRVNVCIHAQDTSELRVEALYTKEIQARLFPREQKIHLLKFCQETGKAGGQRKEVSSYDVQTKN
jgi:hypothetical protein